MTTDVLRRICDFAKGERLVVDGEVLTVLQVLEDPFNRIAPEDRVLVYFAEDPIREGEDGPRGRRFIASRMVRVYVEEK